MHNKQHEGVTIFAISCCSSVLNMQLTMLLNFNYLFYWGKHIQTIILHQVLDLV